MQCSKLIEKLNKLAPENLACEWDNPGLLAGRTEKEIRRVLIALDVTDKVVEQARKEKVDLILTHHPLIFKPLKQVNDKNFISRRIIEMIQADICCYAMHTNFDIAPGCMADLASDCLGMISEEPLEITGEINGQPVGIGKVGTLPVEMSLAQLGKRVKEVFELPFVTIYGMREITESVSRIAISPGAGGSMISHGLEKKAQVLITGDIGHHNGIDAVANHMAVIDAGHYGVEHIFIPFMAEYLKENVDESLEIIMAEPDFPATVIG